MKKTEMAKLFAIIAEVYPTFEVSEFRIELFRKLLGDLDFAVVEKASYMHISTNKYPPTVAHIRQHAVEIMSLQPINANDAWDEVYRAIRKYGRPRADIAVQSLSPLTARVVKSIGFTEICMSENPSVIRGQFIKLYNELLQEEVNKLMVPKEYRELASKTGCDELFEKSEDKGEELT